MLILGFESSCDETAAAVVEYTSGTLSVRSDIVASQVDIHRLYGGVVPEIAGRAHIEAISRITYEALETAGVKLSDITVVAVTSHPGLIGALLVAVNFAKALASANHLPLVEVDHMRAHIATAYLAGEGAPKPPFLAAALSGGHTSIYEVRDYTDFRLIGATRDDAIGEAFDKIGRVIGIPYPAGAGFDKLAREGFERATGKTESFWQSYPKTPAYRDPDMRLPSPAIAGENLDFSFSGLKTAAINVLHHYEQLGTAPDRPLFAARYTYEAVEAVGEKLDRALAAHPGWDLVVSGGVAANSHLRARLRDICGAHGVRLFVPAPKLCGDNGAMVAAQGCYEYLSGARATSALNARATDD
jgi:N6-L-threonylcarbamoyladenine synthase